jgi:hypothetical protein
MTRTAQKRVQNLSSKTASGSNVFKYYIHDTAEGYSLQMSGPFTEAVIDELSSCWETARTTLKDRNLILDLRGLTSVDDTAKQWLVNMSADGARCLPDSFLAEAWPKPSSRKRSGASRQSIFGRLSNALRGCA